MEAIKNTLDELTSIFNNRMTDFQNELKGAIPATSPTSNVTSQFNSFRSFVLTALENLQRQVELLSRQQDEIEMRSRVKILLLHGVTEESKENAAVCAAKILSDKLKLAQVNPDSFSRCHRMGNPNKDKPRPILVKFRDLSLRHKVWSSKTCLKATGVTLSEFLTKARHRIFLLARQRFGISKCWTRDGAIIVMSSDGSRHRISTMAELHALGGANQDITKPLIMGESECKSSKVAGHRLKRTLKK